MADDRNSYKIIDLRTNCKASNALHMLVKREKFSGPGENCQGNVADSLVTSSRLPATVKAR